MFALYLESGVFLVGDLTMRSILGRQTPHVQRGDMTNDFGGLMEAGGGRLPSEQALVLELMRWLNGCWDVVILCLWYLVVLFTLTISRVKHSDTNTGADT